MVRALFFGGTRRGGGKEGGAVLLVLIVVAVVFMVLAPFLSRLAHMAISRKRDLADASGVRFSRNPEGLARALEKIAASEPLEPLRGEKTVASLYLANPFKRVRRDSVWASHPPIQDRIERLRRM